MTYKKDVCVRCGCEVVTLKDEIRPLCVDCVRVERMVERIQKRREEAQA